MTEKSLANLGTSTVDLQQLHVWSDAWADDEGWKRAAEDLKRQKLINAFGISVNRWEPANVIKALRTGLVDAVQVVYNVFDQNPEDELFPVCRELDIAVIARVPFDEGSLTGHAHERQPRGPKATGETSISRPRISPKRSRASSVSRRSCPAGMDLPEMALRFILAEPDRVDGHSGHAQDRARRAEHRGQRRQPAGALQRSYSALRETPLGAASDGLLSDIIGVS